MMKTINMGSTTHIMHGRGGRTDSSKGQACTPLKT